MRCLICDFNENEPLSILGTQTGVLSDGRSNCLVPDTDLCLACVEAIETTYQEDQTSLWDLFYLDDPLEDMPLEPTEKPQEGKASYPATLLATPLQEASVRSSNAVLDPIYGRPTPKVDQRQPEPLPKGETKRVNDPA